MPKLKMTYLFQKASDHGIYNCLKVGLDDIHEALPEIRQEDFDALFYVIRMEGIGLDQDQDSLDVIPARFDGRMNDIPQLLFGSQLIEGGFSDQVGKESQCRIGFHIQSSHLKSNFHTRICVRLVEFREAV